AGLAVEMLALHQRERESLSAELVERVRSAAERGEAGAAFELGMMARHGRGMARDLEQARRWLTQAADAGVVAARRELGELGIADKDAEHQREAALLLASAADAGDAGAQFLHGRVLQFGIGGRADAAAAGRRFEQAALQGHPEARLALAQVLWRGSHKEREQALAWLLWPRDDEQLDWIRFRASEYARGRDRATPADPAFALLLAS